MSTFLFILALIAMLAVAGILFTGIFGMVRGGDFNAKWGNRLMRWRVAMQGVAIVLLVALAWAWQHGK